MNNIKKFRATIFGESYVLISDQPDEHLSLVESLVDNKIKSIAKKSQSDDPKKLAVLAALQIASELLYSKQSLINYGEKSQKLLDMISSEGSC